MTAIAVSGSLAFDTILMHPHRFHESLDKDNLEALNVCLYVPQVINLYGGTAGNIAYNLRLLDEMVEVLGTVGPDGDRYVSRLNEIGARTTGVRTHQSELTAHAYILTDSRNSQLTAFHAGAMGHPLHSNANSYLPEGEWAIVSSEGTEAMVYLMEAFTSQGTKTIFDPGQALTIFSKEGLVKCIEKAYLTILNEHEYAMLKQKLGADAESFLENRMVIVTLGADGVNVLEKGKVLHVGVGKPDVVKDATGCGDAFRAGLLTGLRRGWGLEASLQLGSTMGAIAVSSDGGQSHTPSMLDIKSRFTRDFAPWPEVTHAPVER